MPIDIDINAFEENRLLSIKAFNLKNVDEKYKFYYDETNNIRKLYINEENKLNVTDLRTSFLAVLFS